MKGLKIIENYIDEDKENELIDIINKQKWNTSLKRLTQHYGYKYNYKSRNLTHDDKIGDIPKWLSSLIKYDIDQIIINRYLQGEGISAHIDNTNIFDDMIISLSLGSACEMIFSKYGDIKKYYIKPRTLLIITKDARYKYRHEIKNKIYDIIDGKVIERNTRYSITFRKVILNHL